MRTGPDPEPGRVPAGPCQTRVPTQTNQGPDIANIAVPLYFSTKVEIRVVYTAVLVCIIRYTVFLLLIAEYKLLVLAT